jgi:hypothetical protein
MIAVAGAWLGHEPGDSRGQQRHRAGSPDLALTSGEGSEQRRPRGRAVYGMQEVRTLSSALVRPSNHPAMREPGEDSPHSLTPFRIPGEREYWSPRPSKYRRIRSGHRQAGGGLRRTKPAPSPRPLAGVRSPRGLT